jgi:hypothetical protein
VFCIVISGELKLIDSKNDCKILSAKNCFGKSALLHNQVRQEKVTSNGPCVLVCISGKNYRTLLEKFNLENNYDSRSISNLYFFKHSSTDSQNSLNDLVITRTHKGKIVCQNEEIKKIYFILEGSVICLRNGRIMKKLSVFDHYGETYYLGEEFNLRSYYTLIAEGYAVIQEIEITKIKEKLCENVLQLIKYGIFKAAMNNSEKKLNHLTESDMQDVFSMSEFKAYRRPEMVYQNEVVENKIVIVVTGSLLSKSDLKLLARSEEIYGDKLIYSNKTYQYVIPEDDCLVLEVNWKKISNIIINES